MIEPAADIGEWYAANFEAAVEGTFAAIAGAWATLLTAFNDTHAAWAACMDNSAKLWAADTPGGSEVLATHMVRLRTAGATPLRNWDQEYSL